MGGVDSGRGGHRELTSPESINAGFVVPSAHVLPCLFGDAGLFGLAPLRGRQQVREELGEVDAAAQDAPGLVPLA